MRRSYQRNDDQREGDEAQDALESYVREGAQQMLAAVLEEEVNAFLGRHRPGPSPPWAVTALGRHRYVRARHFVGIGTGTTRLVN